MEVNLLPRSPEYRTLTFFVNDVQQPHHFNFLPPSIIFVVSFFFPSSLSNALLLSSFFLYLHSGLYYSIEWVIHISESRGIHYSTCKEADFDECTALLN